MAISVTSLPAYGLLGGSFDPVHGAHLTLAEQVRVALGLTQMSLLPAAHQPLKKGAKVSAEQRTTMLQLALENYPHLSVDGRELERVGPSYTVDTLRQWRAEYGSNACLCFCLGVDSLLQLDRWYQSDELLKMANLVVLARPGWTLDTAAFAHFPKALAHQLKEAQCDSVAHLLSRRHGAWLVLKTPLFDVSSTGLREQLAAGVPATALAQLPAAVANYIEQHGLYRAS